jgi:hypothetical protein
MSIEEELRQRAAREQLLEERANAEAAAAEERRASRWHGPTGEEQRLQNSLVIVHSLANGRWAPESDANWTSDADEWERLATDAARDAVAKVLKPVVADLEEQLQQVRAERLNRRSESEPEPSNFLARLLGRA